MQSMNLTFASTSRMLYSRECYWSLHITSQALYAREPFHYSPFTTLAITTPVSGCTAESGSPNFATSCCHYPLPPPPPSRRYPPQPQMLIYCPRSLCFTAVVLQ